MKKIISTLLVSIMILCTVSTAIPVFADWGLKIQSVNALYFDEKPTVDGIVSEEEWGPSTFEVDQSLAVQVITQNDYPWYNDTNTFFYRNPSGHYDAASLNMSYSMWLRWDENYFYVAAKVKDPDGHSLKNGKENTWNGDALQFRVDPAGANAVYDPLNPTEYDAMEDGKPWSSSGIDDICVGFVESAGGFTEAWVM